MIRRWLSRAGTMRPSCATSQNPPPLG
ncbi:hypothetical protein ACFYXR_22585 [Pseudomonas qingdaonensis]